MQLHEILQFDTDLFHTLHDAGIAVGSEVTVLNRSGVVELTRGDVTVTVGDDLSHAIRIDLV